HADYLAVNRLCDFMIDTLHWSGGNTTLDALASGLPVVTWPGKFMRGRQSMAMLRILGLDELIAESADQYVEIARRLGRDADWRQSISNLIADRRQRLFDDPAPVEALAALLRARVAGQAA
ncbi:MAG: hypothetical protein JNK75_13670, partial [Betaproteobacteria bacterium]|nr:hypothetical protein [Betaproteobacteria bacterium]